MGEDGRLLRHDEDVGAVRGRERVRQHPLYLLGEFFFFVILLSSDLGWVDRGHDCLRVLADDR